ncbi:hypothetical protein HELRODRAFT_94589, partial [Helobdella robusta]|uniref:AB hydrolase-1 domain-containing protein n=1 Tax=Helobdella robusta TaxID=6412 RepID=T1G919_HELRO
MVLCFRILTFIFTFNNFYHIFIKNPWKWFTNILRKFFGFEDFKSLRRSEEKLLRCLSPPDHVKTAQDITLGRGRLKIWTISVKSKNSSEIPLVLLHSLGYGASFWSLNLGELSSSRPVYAIDMLGFGRSSRMAFSTCPTNIELEFAKFLEAWRAEMKLDRFILLGHGFGAYVAFLYVSRYPEHVAHVIFVEPWGFEVDSKQYKKFDVSSAAPKFPLSNSIKMTAFFIQFLNQYSLLRFAGPGWGIDIIKKFRSDLLEKFAGIADKDTVAQYLFYWNGICTPTGETAFFELSNHSGSARHPIFFRINSLCRTLPMTFIIGSRSNYIGHNLGHQIKALREGSYVDIQVVNGAGHYLFIEKHQLFNDLVNLICFRVD